jgi:hypothetical protein
MTTLILMLDDHAARRAHQAAQRRQASLEDLVRQFVEKLGRTESDAGEAQREAAAKQMEVLFRQLSRPLGGKGYITRDELYERSPVS